jgi:hypothetical protein
MLLGGGPVRDPQILIVNALLFAFRRFEFFAQRVSQLAFLPPFQALSAADP